jgi:type IV secretion system protein VirB9
MKLVAALLLLLSMLPTFASPAGESPRAGAFDRRIRTIDYNPESVTRLVFHVGFAMEIVFDKDEAVEPEAWSGITSAYNVTSLGNSVVIRAIKVAPTTNLFLRTNLRRYWFDFIQAPVPPLEQSKAVLEDPDLVYSLRFRYPIQDFTNSLTASQAALEARRARQLAEKEKATQQASANTQTDTLSYSGDESLKPIRAYTKGQLTILEFSNEQVIPSIYIAAPDNSELQAQRSMLSTTEVAVHHVGKAIILRAGKAVGAVYNERFMATNERKR